LIEVVGLLVICGVTAYSYNYTISDPVVPDGTPSELMTMSDAKLDGLSDGLVVYDSSPIHVRIECSEINSLGGYWYGTEAHLQIAGRSSEIEGLPTKTNKTWGDVITVPFLGKDVTPDFTALLPITKDDNHQTIHIMARMHVGYPNRNWGPGGGFYDSSSNVTKEVNLLVVSPEDIQLRSEIQDASSSRTSVIVAGMFGALGWAFVAGPLISALYNRLARKRLVSS
jgi:hypothetical protein